MLGSKIIGAYPSTMNNGNSNPPIVLVPKGPRKRFGNPSNLLWTALRLLCLFYLQKLRLLRNQTNSLPVNNPTNSMTIRPHMGCLRGNVSSLQQFLSHHRFAKWSHSEYLQLHIRFVSISCRLKNQNHQRMSTGSRNRKNLFRLHP